MSDKIKCPVCNSNNQQAFLNRKNVPVQQNNFFKTRIEAVECPKGDLTMTFCHNCGFVYNKSFSSELMNYSSSYNNAQEASSHFLQHLAQLKSKLVNKGLKNSKIVEVGCGKGYFLKSLIENKSLNNSGYGFDPSYEGQVSLFNDRLKFKKQNFDDTLVDFAADALICRHVIEHIPEPVIFLKQIKAALNPTTPCRLFFETPCVNWIFATRTIWDFFYEHCSIFSQESLPYLFEICGFCINEISKVFSGQYLWLEAENSSYSNPAPKLSDTSRRIFADFANYESERIKQWQQLISLKHKEGGLAIWGAGAKGVTFLNLLDADTSMIEFAIDQNPKKQNLFIPGSGHEVLSYKELEKHNIKNIIVMNPNYAPEIRQTLANEGLTIKIITDTGVENENKY